MGVDDSAATLYKCLRGILLTIHMEKEENMFISKAGHRYLPERLFFKGPKDTSRNQTTERRHMDTGTVCEFFILLLYIIKIIFH